MKWRFWSPQNPSRFISCDLAEPLLSLYTDGMASVGEADLVERHLSVCEDCRRALGWMQATQRVISERPAALPPVDLRARIAREIAESRPPALTVRTARRPVVLRPALFAAAASLIAAGVLVEHSLLTAPARNAASGPPRVALLPTTSSRPAPPAPPASRPAERIVRPSRMAAAAPRVTARALPPRPDAAPPLARVAKAATPPAPDEAPGTGGPIAAGLRPPAAGGPRKPVQVAKKSEDRPHDMPPQRQRVAAATRPPDTITDVHAGSALAAPTPGAVPPPLAAEVVHPEVTRVAVTTPSAARPAREDALSSVRPSLVALNADYSRKIARSDVAHVQATAYNSSGNFPAIIATSYTPGLNDKPEPQRGKTNTEQTTPH